MAFDAQALQATIANYVRETVNNAMRHRPLYRMLMERGGIKYNMGGEQWETRIEMNILGATAIDDTDTINFNTVVRYKTRTIRPRSYGNGERLSRFQVQRNKGPQAIINLVQDARTKISRDFLESMQDDIYIDGAAAGNTKKWEGVETFATAHASQKGDGGRVRLPDGSYGGLTTDLGFYGGTWSSVSGETATTSWPNGTSRTPKYDFWSPLLIDSSATTDGTIVVEPWGPNPSWAAYCQDQLSYAIQMAKRAPQSEAMEGLDLFTMQSKKYWEFRKNYGGFERLQVTGQPQDVATGVKQILSYDGVPFVEDFGCPADTVYGMAFSHMQYCSVTDDILDMEEPGMTEDRMSMLFPIFLHGNWQFNPRGFVKIYPYT